MFLSAPARHMIQESRPPKTFQMRWSVSFDSTPWCTALFTLWLATRSSHVSKWITPWLALWWTGLWQMMGNTRSCFWEQVRHNFYFLETQEGSGSQDSSSTTDWNPWSDTMFGGLAQMHMYAIKSYIFFSNLRLLLLNYWWYLDKNSSLPNTKSNMFALEKKYYRNK